MATQCLRTGITSSYYSFQAHFNRPMLSLLTPKVVIVMSTAELSTFPVSNLDLKFWILAECNTLPSSQTAEILFELLLLKVDRSKAQSERILSYLASAEQDEEDVWLRDDIRIAWITVLYAANDRPTPWEWAFNRVIGGHPSKVIPILVERRQKHAELALPPRKPVVNQEQALAKKAGA